MRRLENELSGCGLAEDPRAFGLKKAAYSVKETLELLSIGRTKFYELVDQNDLKITKLGSKSLIYVTDIVAFLAKLRAPRNVELNPREKQRRSTCPASIKTYR